MCRNTGEGGSLILKTKENPRLPIDQLKRTHGLQEPLSIRSQESWMSFQASESNLPKKAAACRIVVFAGIDSPVRRHGNVVDLPAILFAAAHRPQQVIFIGLGI